MLVLSYLMSSGQLLHQASTCNCQAASSEADGAGRCASWSCLLDAVQTLRAKLGLYCLGYQRSALKRNMILPPVGMSGRALPAHPGQTLRPASCNRTARRVQAASTAIEEAPAKTQLQLASAPHTHPVLSAVSGTRAWATQLWTGFKRGDGASAASDALDNASLVIDTAERAQEVLS